MISDSTDSCGTSSTSAGELMQRADVGERPPPKDG